MNHQFLIDLLLPLDDQVVYDDSREVSRRQYADAFSILCKQCADNQELLRKVQDRMMTGFSGTSLRQTRARRCFQGIEFLSGENRLYAHRGSHLHQNWNTAFRTIHEAIYLVAWLTISLPPDGHSIAPWLASIGPPFSSLNQAFAQVAGSKSFPQRAENTLACAAQIIEALRSLESIDSRSPLGTATTDIAPNLLRFLAEREKVGLHGITDALRSHGRVLEGIVRVYSPLPGVRALALISSLAKGWGDQYSDLDVVAFCSDIPSEQDRKGAIDELVQEGATFSITGQRDDFEWNGLPGHVLLARLDEQRRSLLHMHDGLPGIGFVLPPYDFLAYKHLGGDPQIGYELVRLASAYPESVRRGVLERETLFITECSSRLEKAASEGDVVSFFLTASYAGISMAYLLCAANRVHCDDVGLKWANRILDALRDKPPLCVKRMEGISLEINSGNMNQKAADFRTLVEDLLKIRGIT